MIDFDKLKYAKLKYAFELSEKLKCGLHLSVSSSELGYSFYIGECESEKDLISMTDLESGSIDVIINKLEELTKETPEPKFKVGQEVWFEDSMSALSFFVEDVFCNSLREWEYSGLQENDLYPTREALIISNIEHWKNLLSEPQACEHERDGHFYSFSESGVIGFNSKCEKCGEFYG